MHSGGKLKGPTDFSRIGNWAYNNGFNLNDLVDIQISSDTVTVHVRPSLRGGTSIGRTVKDMHEEVDALILIMKKERQAIEGIIRHIDGTLKSMGEIVIHVEQVFGMIQTIATATEEQSATAEDVNRTMVGINDVTRQLTVSVSEIKGTSENFARLASDLQQMVGWFKL